MPRYAAFLRGVMPVNAKMSDLKKAFEAAGFTDVKTILGSGNVVFSARCLGGVAPATGRGRDGRAIGSHLPHDHTADRSAPGPARVRPLPSLSPRARREARRHVPAPAAHLEIGRAHV